MTSSYYNGYTGFFGFLVFFLDIWAIVNVVGSRRSVFNKVLWVIVILFLPLLGFILWAIFGPRAART